ncbi:MAG: hypothetical protein KDA85_16445, partial [Planctomycetaceae bacterium]|nr:hypothetical protein [Planctomycetaceae bacterium]
EWKSFTEEIRLLSPVTKERRAIAWSLLDRIATWLGEGAAPGEAEKCLQLTEQLIAGPFDTDPRLLAQIAALHEQYGDTSRAARLTEWAAMHPRADADVISQRNRLRAKIAPAVASDGAADALIADAMNQPENDAVATSLINAKKHSQQESPHYQTYFAARELQLRGEFAEAARLYATLVSGEQAGPETLLHYAECEQSLSHASEAANLLRENLLRNSIASPDVWNRWLQISFRDLALTPQQVLQQMPAPPPRKTAEQTSEQQVRWLLEQLVAGNPIRVNCGGERYTSAHGELWAEDGFFTCGTEYFGTEGDHGTFARPIRNTADGVLYQSERYFSTELTEKPPGYQIPLPNGTYEVKLGFAEIYPAERSFDVRLEDQIVLTEYDPAITHADVAAAFEHSFQAVVEDGQLELLFESRNGSDPKISCFQISAVNTRPEP